MFTRLWLKGPFVSISRAGGCGEVAFPGWSAGPAVAAVHRMNGTLCEQGGDPETASFPLSMLKGGHDLSKLSDPKMEVFPPGQNPYQGDSGTVFQQQEGVAWDAGPGTGSPRQMPLVPTVGSGFQG